MSGSEIYVAIWVFIFGACIGSFLNVCIVRLPQGKSVLRPRSHNAQGTPLKWFDLLPIVSYLLLRGKDRQTGQRFSPRYLVVELLTACLFLALWLVHGASTPAYAILMMVFAAILVAASFTDLEHMLLPDTYTVGAAAVGLVLALVFPQALHGLNESFAAKATLMGLRESLLGLFVGSGLVLWLLVWADFFLKKQVVGEGDVFLLGMVGAFTGWQGAVCALFFGSFLGAVFFVILLPLQFIISKTKKGTHINKGKNKDEAEAAKQSTFGKEVPFGPWLALGALAYVFGFSSYIDAYFAQMARLLQ